MARTDVVTVNQRGELQKAIDLARELSGLVYGVYVGPLAEGRDSAIAAHAQLPNAEDAVLIAVDTDGRTLDIVTGSKVALILDDRACELALLTLKSSLAADDLVGGVRNAALQLAQHARAPRTVNVEEPA